MPTFGREVNWKSMGASVDRSDLGLWAIIRSNYSAGWQTRVEREFRACRDRPVDHKTDTPFHHEARIISILL
jgi:hypothetical protein